MLYVPAHFDEEPYPTNRPTEMDENSSLCPSQVNTPTRTIQYEYYTVSSYPSLDFQHLPTQELDKFVVHYIQELDSRLASVDRGSDTPLNGHFNSHASQEKNCMHHFGYPEKDSGYEHALNQRVLEWENNSVNLIVTGQSVYSPGHWNQAQVQTSSREPSETSRHTVTISSTPLTTDRLDSDGGDTFSNLFVHGCKINLGDHLKGTLIARHGGIEEETLAEHGDVVDVISFDCSSCGIHQTTGASWETSTQISNSARVRAETSLPKDRNERRLHLGFPSVSPRTCIREGLLSDLFYALLQRVTNPFFPSQPPNSRQSSLHQLQKHPGSSPRVNHALCCTSKTTFEPREKDDRLLAYLQEQRNIHSQSLRSSNGSSRVVATRVHPRERLNHNPLERTELPLKRITSAEPERRASHARRNAPGSGARLRETLADIGGLPPIEHATEVSVLSSSNALRRRRMNSTTRNFWQEHGPNNVTSHTRGKALPTSQRCSVQSALTRCKPRRGGVTRGVHFASSIPKVSTGRPELPFPSSVTLEAPTMTIASAASVRSLCDRSRDLVSTEVILPVLSKNSLTAKRTSNIACGEVPFAMKPSCTALRPARAHTAMPTMQQSMQKKVNWLSSMDQSNS